MWSQMASGLKPEGNKLCGIRQKKRIGNDSGVGEDISVLNEIKKASKLGDILSSWGTVNGLRKCTGIVWQDKVLWEFSSLIELAIFQSAWSEPCSCKCGTGRVGVSIEYSQSGQQKFQESYCNLDHEI